MEFKDKNGRILEHYDSVTVPDPELNDEWNHSFVGQIDTDIESKEEGFCYVVDGDDFYICIESSRLEFHEEYYPTAKDVLILHSIGINNERKN